MVLAALGRPMTEAALRALTDCSPLGTEAFQLVEAARQLGFPASRKYTLASLEELAIMLAEGHLPIVYVDLWPLQGGLSSQYHAMVVIELDPAQVTVLDPLHGERRISREAFQEAWSAMRFLTIVIASDGEEPASTGGRL
jgi:ABC-type bacteriocin/lantibiotic exporter with double-glycine peptidase domain